VRAVVLAERWDGSGYPRGLGGEDIPQSARISAIADVYDALRSPRPYKAPWPEEEAAREVRKEIHLIGGR
jgi:putative two-component system response regulator